MTFCPTTGKVCPATRKSAKRAWLHARSRTGDNVKRQVYKCPSCGWFHFGRRPEHIRKSFKGAPT